MWKRAKFWAVRRRGSDGGGGVGRGGLAEGESGEGVRRREGVRGSAQILDAPTKILNTHGTDTPHHNTTHSVVLGKGGPSQGSPWLKKTRHEQQSFRRAAPLAGSRMVRKSLGTKQFDQKKGAKWRSGPKRCGPKVAGKTKKHGKTNQKQNHSHSPKTKKTNKQNRNKENTQNQPKMDKKSLTSPSQTKKSKKSKNQQQNQKLKKSERKEIKSKNCSNKKNIKKNNQKMFLFFLFFFFYNFSIIF